MRGCWAPAAARPVAIADPPAAPPRSSDPAARLRDFVPVELLRDRRIVVAPARPRDEEAVAPELPDPESLPALTTLADRVSGGLTLFGEVEPA